MAKFLFQKNITIGPGKLARSGDVVDESDLPSVYIKHWLSLGHMIPHDETELRNTRAETTHRDPKPKRRGRRKKDG